MTELIGYLAAFFTTASFLPQAIKTIQTKDVSGVSILMYSMFVIGVSFWLIYGCLLGNMLIVVANVITLILAGAVLMVKIRHQK